MSNDERVNMKRGSRGQLWYDIVDDMIERLEGRVDALELNDSKQDALLSRMSEYLKDKYNKEAEEIDGLYASIYLNDDATESGKLSDL